MARYRVHWVVDDTDALQEDIAEILAGDETARVVSVTWQPDRPNIHGGNPVPAGYTLVMVHDDA